ncbi:MAG: hypothetical protein AB1631_02370 [Acidobacteriota bacterium]
MKFAGTWHIYEMELWDEEYFNMEVQAYIRINSRGHGKFQFGLVSGSLYGGIVTEGTRKKFEFKWEGNDECDPARGSGWIKLKNENSIKGRIKFHQGDSSKFWAEKAG